MDTVAPGEGVKPIVEGDIIRTDGTTVLGGDDKSGCAIICETIHQLREQQIPHGPVDAVFTICEEIGLLGAKHLDLNMIEAREGLVYDSDSPGYLFVRAPGAKALRFTVRGLEAHAGMAPERGLSAIKIASEAIAAMRLGRVDDETTANLGLIQGGRALNIIPNEVVVRGEARSRNNAKLDRQVAHMIQCFEDAVGRANVTLEGKRFDACLELRGSHRVRSDERARRRADRAQGRGSGAPRRARGQARSDGRRMRRQHSESARAWWWPTSAPGCATFTPCANGSISMTWPRPPRSRSN